MFDFTTMVHENSNATPHENKTLRCFSLVRYVSFQNSTANTIYRAVPRGREKVVFNIRCTFERWVKNYITFERKEKQTTVFDCGFSFETSKNKDVS